MKHNKIIDVAETLLDAKTVLYEEVDAIEKNVGEKLRGEIADGQASSSNEG